MCHQNGGPPYEIPKGEPHPQKVAPVQVLNPVPPCKGTGLCRQY